MLLILLIAAMVRGSLMMLAPIDQLIHNILCSGNFQFDGLRCVPCKTGFVAINRKCIPQSEFNYGSSLAYSINFKLLNKKANSSVDEKCLDGIFTDRFKSDTSNLNESSIELPALNKKPNSLLVINLEATDNFTEFQPQVAKTPTTQTEKSEYPPPIAHCKEYENNICFSCEDNFYFNKLTRQCLALNPSAVVSPSSKKLF